MIRASCSALYLIKPGVGDCHCPITSAPCAHWEEERNGDNRPDTDLLLGFVCRALGHVVARLALVAADGAHVVVALQAPRHQELGVGHSRRRGALQLAVSLRQRPQTVLQAGEPLVCP